MKKLYILFSFTFLTSMLFAQVNIPVVNPQPLNHPINLKVNQPNNSKTVNCTDTVEYPISKLTGLPEVDTLDYSTYISGTAQTYYFSGTGTLRGISAHVYLDIDGVPGNSTPIIMTIKAYDVNASDEPSVLIDSADVQVMDVGFQAQALMFATPIAISDTFAIALEINPLFPANPYYVTNSSVNEDGNDEGLSSIEFSGGTWLNTYDAYGNAWDIDMMLSPIFTTDITSFYTASPTSVCPNDTVTFTNASTVNTDAMFNMYNGTTNPIYEWDFDDGTGTYTPFDTTYAYSAPGSYNSSLTVNYYGYTQNCFETTNTTVTVHDTAVANFGWTEVPPGSTQFSDSSSNAMVYSWDFGDGSPLDSTQNPFHTFSMIPSYVCLTVTDSNGCNQSTYCDTVDLVMSVEDYSASNNVNIYPIPANKYFNVSIPTNYLNGQIILTDVVGQKIKSVQIDNNEKVKVYTDEISSGIYFVSIDHQGERVYTQRIVIDK